MSTADHEYFVKDDLTLVELKQMAVTEQLPLYVKIDGYLYHYVLERTKQGVIHSITTVGAPVNAWPQTIRKLT